MKSKLTSKQIKWCKQHLPEGKWKVNPEGLVDVEGDVFLRHQKFQKLPVLVGRVKGRFALDGCKQLLTLEGSPQKVGGWFDCDGCISLQSLTGAPQSVGRWFTCEGCTGLPEWVHELVNDFDEEKITWKELLQTHDKFLEKPQLVQAKNLGLF